MSDLSAAAHAVLARQHGVASVEDLIQAGLHRAQIKDIVRRGALELALPGAYRSPSVSDDELQRSAAVCRAHPELVIGGPTAGRLYGLRRMPADQRIHVIAPPHSHPTLARWVKVFRTPTLRRVDVLERDDGIRVLDRPRLALDLARFLDDRDLTSVVEQCMQDGRHDTPDMIAAAIDWVSPRRRWLRRYLEIVRRRIDGPAAESHLEVIVGDRLRACGVEDLVRQYAVRLRGFGNVRFDLAIPELRWAVEVDGFPTHRETIGSRADAARDDAARREGWTVRRLGPSQFGRALDASIRALADEVAHLRRRASSFVGEM
ncbi:type IV toxin-antitoxin system AbiEi family antitoxin domain-containing protein [Ilumatobacter nonamiensis]|uniref:type IV toxin-antitoxin system AbiEi family antitoxin domain-containing protein n=1 Tax=Ilumatobacter nonamiensis TaxID=467093 RepID=UPI00034A5915|nr:type IV toxin-antitoxin system AbiEi family antitoxin domain-containing protein [Ilumatobacter nonamiensis]